MYTMGFYRLSNQIHGRIDTIRSKFFWRGANDKARYHMVKCEAVCRPKDFGGLRVLNTRLMNDCMLSKWMWRINGAKDELWFRLLKAKYFPHGDYRDSLDLRGSQFWKALCRVKHLFNWGVSYQAGNGKSISFWKDVWIGNCPFYIRFNRLYSICLNPDIKLSDCLVHGIWNIRFVRNFGVEEEGLWRELKEIIRGVVLNEENDRAVWCLEKSKQFSVKSLYRHLMFGGVIAKRFHNIWASTVPLKVKIFLWQFYLNRLPTTDQMMLRHWKGDNNCWLCGVPEDLNHVFFHCLMARFV